MRAVPHEYQAFPTWDVYIAMAVVAVALAYIAYRWWKDRR